jgi:hypothetical protein
MPSIETIIELTFLNQFYTISDLIFIHVILHCAVVNMFKIILLLSHSKYS